MVTRDLLQKHSTFEATSEGFFGLLKTILETSRKQVHVSKLQDLFTKLDKYGLTSTIPTMSSEASDVYNQHVIIVCECLMHIDCYDVK